MTRDAAGPTRDGSAPTRDGSGATRDGSGPHVAILGTRGVPAMHGGFETFADHLARFLVAAGWRVTVYCQATGSGAAHEDEWNGVRRVHVPVARGGPAGTVVFDARAAFLATRDEGVHLVLGYNTAVLNLVLRAAGKHVVMNMDGLEWQREKWSLPARTWLRVNEYVGMKTSQRLVADHPMIEERLRLFRPATAITMIPYGADVVTQAGTQVVTALGLEPGGYYLTVARIEPENSLLSIVEAHAARPNGKKLVVLGSFEPGTNEYHAALARAAADTCLFPGPIYDKDAVQALRFHAFAYVHGHTVGGTNPSLVESMGAGNAVVAHDNRFNRWVAGEGALYFSDTATLVGAFDALESDPSLVSRLAGAATERHRARFTWEIVLDEYLTLLTRALGAAG